MDPHLDLEESSREEFLKARRDSLGGSDFAALLGDHRFKSPYTIYLEKNNELEEPEDDRWEEIRWWGQQLEPITARRLQLETDYEVVENPYLWKNEEYGFMHATPDYFLEHPDKDGMGILECKATMIFNREEWEGKAPQAAVDQLFDYMWQFGYTWGVAAGCIGGNQLFYQEYEWTDDLADLILSTKKNFWENHILEDVPPDPSGLNQEGDVLEEMFPAEDVEDRTEALGMDEVRAIHRYREAKQAEKRAKKEKEKAKQKIQKKMGSAVRAVGGPFEVTWKPVQRKGYTVDPTTYRQFNVNERDDD